MTIPAASRQKLRNTSPTFPLEEIQVDTVPNLEPQGISTESKYNYFLILCDRFSRTFNLIGIQDKSSEACIDGIELLLSRLPNNNKIVNRISHIIDLMQVLNLDQILLENGAVKTKLGSQQQHPNTKNKMDL